MASDFNVKLLARLWSDSSAAKGMASRRGAGRVRDIHTPALWVQQWVSRKELLVKKRAGRANVAEIGTKHLDYATMLRLLQSLNLSFMPEPDPHALAVQRQGSA